MFISLVAASVVSWDLAVGFSGRCWSLAADLLHKTSIGDRSVFSVIRIGIVAAETITMSIVIGESEEQSSDEGSLQHVYFTAI